MPTYLTFAAYKQRSRLRDSIIDRAGVAKVEAWLSEHSAQIRDRLVKRYAVDFTDPGPTSDTVCRWLAAFVDHDVQEFVGGTPEGREDEWIVRRRDKADEELREAANSEEGWIELPLRGTDKLGSSAINKGGPFAVEYLTPLDAFDVLAKRRCP